MLCFSPLIIYKRQDKSSICGRRLNTIYLKVFLSLGMLRVVVDLQQQEAQTQKRTIVILLSTGEQ